MSEYISPAKERMSKSNGRPHTPNTSPQDSREQPMSIVEIRKRQTGLIAHDRPQWVDSGL